MRRPLLDAQHKQMQRLGTCTDLYCRSWTLSTVQIHTTTLIISMPLLKTAMYACAVDPSLERPRSLKQMMTHLPEDWDCQLVPI